MKKTIKVTLNSVQENPYTPGKDYTFSVDKDVIQEIIKQNPELLNGINTPTHKRKYFVPKVGEEFWYIGYSGEGCVYKDIFGSRMFELILIDQGNCFATEQDAQDELNRRQSLVRIWNNYDDKYSWDIDWEDDKEVKCGLTFDYMSKTINYDNNWFCKTSTELPYFKSAEDRNQFVSENEKDLLIVFNIKK